MGSSTSAVKNREATAQAETYVVSRKAGTPVFASATSYEAIGHLQFGKEVVPTGRIISDVDGDGCEMLPIHPKGVVELKHLSEKAKQAARRRSSLNACPETDNREQWTTVRLCSGGVRRRAAWDYISGEKSVFFTTDTKKLLRTGALHQAVKGTVWENYCDKVVDKVVTI